MFRNLTEPKTKPMQFRKYTALILLAVPFLTFCSNPGMKKGKPDITSMSALEFNKDGILFIGDSKGAKVFAVDLNDNDPKPEDKEFLKGDLEGDLAELLGTSKDNVLIHDIAVHPVSQNIYVTVSRGRANWTSRWQLPNDLEDASLLMKISPSGEYSEVSLDNVEYAAVSLPNPVDAEKEHRWKKGTKLRTDAITDIAFYNGKVYVTGLSNSEFSSAMWMTPYPFKEVSATTLEIFHGAHGKWETASPVRTFLPYEMDGTTHMLAAYLCTPLVTFKLDDLEGAKHMKGRTVAEFGSGNYPLDMLVYKNNGKDLIMVSNSQLPLIVFDPQEVAKYEGEIVSETKTYTEGIPFTARSGSGVQQLANYSEKYILVTQRMPSGNLAMVTFPKSWMGI